MTYDVLVTNRFRKDERKLDLKTRSRMYNAITQLVQDPYSYKELKGQLADLRSARFGDFRIIYRINEERKLIELVSVGHRASVY